MLGWASSQFEKLSVAVAPPPADANGRFLYAVQKGDEEGALGCLHEIDAARAVLNSSKGSYAIHLACQNSMDRLIRALLNVPGVDLTFIDSQGNTPLHYATMSTDRARALPVIKMLVTEYKASPCSKNSAGQTPYDLAGLDMVRQYLLPLQLQAETQQAIDNGGVGLPPGIDMGGLRIQNPAAPPPPIMPGMHMPVAPAPMSSPAPHHYQTPQHDAIPNPPASGGGGQQQGQGGYALSGGSSAAIYKPTDGKRVYKADGFHSSSSDVNLQRKYGHVSVAGAAGHPPPPSSGNAGTAFPAAAAGGPPGANPFAGGANPFASGGAKSRYVAYDAVTGQTSTMPSRPVAPGGYAAAPAPVGTPNFAVFSPGGAAPAPVPANNNAYNPAAPGQMHQQQQPQAYQQPHQSHQQDAMAGPAAYPNSAGNQHYQNPAQQQQYHQGYQQAPAQQPQVQQPAATFAPAAAGPMYGQQPQQPQQQQYGMPAQAAAYTPAQPYSQEPEQQQNMVTNNFAPPAAAQPTSAPVPAPAPAVASQGTIAASPVSGGFSLAEQQENAASATHLFSSPSKDVASPVQAASAPVGSQNPSAAVSSVQQNHPSTNGPASASDLFASAPVPTVATTVADSAPAAAASFAASPAPQQAAPVSASDLFGSPPAATSSNAAQEMFAAPGNGPAPAPAPAQVDPGNSPPQGERAASPAASDELLDDVPLSPDGKPTPTDNVSQYSQGFAQPAPVPSQNYANEGFAQPAPAQSLDYANQGFAQPAPTQTQNPPGAAAVPATSAESLFAAIGMPPPPFSANKR